MASGGPSSPGCSGVEGGPWGAASAPVRRGGWVRVCARAERVCTGAGQGPLLAASSHDCLGEMGGPPPSSQIPCLWIHLLTQVCGLDIGLRGASVVTRAGRCRDTCAWRREGRCQVCRTRVRQSHQVRSEAQLQPPSLGPRRAAQRTLAHLAFSFAKCSRRHPAAGFGNQGSDFCEMWVSVRELRSLPANPRLSCLWALTDWNHED